MSALEAGKIFERYRIIRHLGSGISGESYEAEDVILLRKVTLKLIQPWSALSDAARRQFFREMQGISILNHPYLASMLDYGEINGRLYVARRYVSSGSLLGNEGRLWFRPPLNISDAIHYGHQLAEVLEYIHKHGYLHGSLSFANILVLRGPNLDNDSDYAPFLLADVGLANFVRRFGEPQLKLLPITAAPEQLGHRVTQASDQFALAVLVYFWLTGRPPYLGTPEEIEELKLTETITPLLSLNPKATIEQDVVLRRALTVYPEDRYPSVLAFADALLATLPIQSQSEPETEPTPQLTPITQAEPHEVPEPEEVEAVPALEAELIQSAESTSTIEPEPNLQTEATTTEEAYDSELPSEPQPEIAPEPTLDSETEASELPLQSEISSEPALDSETQPESQLAALDEFLSSIEPGDVSEPPSLPEAEPEPEIPVTSLETETDSVSEAETEPIIAESQADVEHEAQAGLVESKQSIEYEPTTESTEDTAQLQQLSDSTLQPTPDVPQPTPDPIPQPVPDVPQPLPTPDIPEPTPDPVPQPAPDAIPQPAPDVPQQVPDPLPQVVPDVPQPLPEPDVPQAAPEPDEQSEPLAEEDLPVAQEPVSSAPEEELSDPVQEQELTPTSEEPETVPLTRLVINSPYTEEPYEVLLEQDEITIGRAGSSDVLLDHDNSTSRHHALLRREGEQYVLYDRHSANGVFVNGQMLMGEVGYILEDGDHISIGSYELIFRSKRPETAEETASESEAETSWSFF